MAPLAPPESTVPQCRSAMRQTPMFPEYPHVFEASWAGSRPTAYAFYVDSEGKRRRLTRNIAVSADTDILGTSAQIRRGVAAILESQYAQKHHAAANESEEAQSEASGENSPDTEGGEEEAAAMDAVEDVS